MLSDIMRLQIFLCVVLLDLFLTCKSAATHNGALSHVHYRGPIGADHQFKEPFTEKWKLLPVASLGCPQRCICKMNDTHHITSVDCSSKGLTMVPPDLPETTVELSLRNNLISNISCESFKSLHRLKHLNLASNKISLLPPCVFQPQSDSLENLKISQNDIEYLDTKLFQNLFYLKTLDLSKNLMKFLDRNTFSDLTQLLGLDLSFNHISGIEAGAFKGLRRLKTLFLFNNKLDEASSFRSDVFQDLEVLESLDIKGNDGNIDSAVSVLKNISHLHMVINTNYRYFNISLGTGYRQLKNLQTLHLGTVFFGKDPRYKSYSVCFLQSVLSDFFENIQTERNLELNLSPCSIWTIESNTFRPLSTLVSLDLSFNEYLSFCFDCCHDWMESLTNTTITYLDLSYTWAGRRPHYISEFCFKGIAETNLKTLVLRNDKILGIGAFRIFPVSIEKLDIRNNNISLHELYTSFAGSSLHNFKLRELYASDQQFLKKSKLISLQASDAPKKFVGDFNSSDTHSKRQYEAKRTKVLSKLPDDVLLNRTHAINMSVEETVNLHSAFKSRSRSENEFLDVFKYERNCPETLKDGNSNITIICLPADLEAIYANSAIEEPPKSVPHLRIINNTVLRHVELTDNPLESWLGPVENVPSLKFLDLSRTQCKNVSVNFFKDMINLETLILTENAIGPSLTSDVSGLTFSTLTNLRMLDMSQNSIKYLSRRAFIHNRNLETLDLSHNRLSEFQPTISSIRNISYLDLSDNLLPGLSEQTCKELNRMHSRNTNFSINLLNNSLLCTCDYLPFLNLVFSTPQIFSSVDLLQFKFSNETKVYYKEFIPEFPLLTKQCLVQRFFIVILVTFFIVVGAVSISAVLYHKRWKLRYLYYIGQRRMHIGEHVVDYIPDADVFITYDQDGLRWRRFMQQTFLPGLNQRNITYILGETDFPGGDLMAHITGAVVGTRKTVVLLSMDIFDDHHREFEMNLAIMREMDTRGLKIVPIFVEEVDLALYPREIEIFLRNQWERCLTYRDSDDFWDGFVNAVREDN